jgi:hypothetical protein
LRQAWGVLLSKYGFWQDIGTSEAGSLGLDPAQQKPGKPDFELLLSTGLRPTDHPAKLELIKSWYSN